MPQTELSGVPETALWTLHNRAEEALRPDSGYADTEAVRLYRALAAEDFERFGPPSQVHSMRAMVLDKIIADFLATHSSGPVVALGEGCKRPTGVWANPRSPGSRSTCRR